MSGDTIKIVKFLSGLAFQLFLVAATSKAGSLQLNHGTELENLSLLGLQWLAMVMLFISWLIVQVVTKNFWYTMANLAFCISAVVAIFLTIGFRVAYTNTDSPQDSLVIAAYSLAAVLSLTGAIWNFFWKR
ncbi:hypothetical protein HELRODRAFT_166518 [Helobdella robusta]|uniref:Uncharacterized protein n=1 Tax=Helobdella robusta TaxID=6412 RepID=T1EY73_HELRO|nr:hypothetical protein HELRODRAFT_166518 [Helobdella robusta]ESO11518.1 hypothetical protein HELRODRAFT_166518 [Helobdella robusta]